MFNLFCAYSNCVAKYCGTLAETNRKVRCIKSLLSAGASLKNNELRKSAGFTHFYEPFVRHLLHIKNSLNTVIVGYLSTVSTVFIITATILNLNYIKDWRSES